MTLTVNLQARHRPDLAQAEGAEPRVAGRAAPAGGGAPPRRHTVRARSTSRGGAPRVAERALRHELPGRLRPASTSRTGLARVEGRRPGADVGGGRIRDAGVARSGKVAERNLSANDVVRANPRAERAGRRPALSAARHGAGDRPAAFDQRAGAARHEEDFGDIIVKTTRRRGHPGARHRAHRARRRRLRVRSPARQQARGGDRLFRPRPAPNALQISDNVRKHHAEIKKAMPTAWTNDIVYDRRSSCAPRSTRDPHPAPNRSRWWFS